MKSHGWVLIALMSMGIAYAQPQPTSPLQPPTALPLTTTSVSFGIGTTILPTPIVAAQSISDGGGGLGGGNFTLTMRASHDISPHWRIPVSFSAAFFRGDLVKSALIVPAANDTLLTQYNITNSVDYMSIQAGIEYYDPQPLITLSAGADVMFSYISSATLDWVVVYNNADLVHQTLPAMSRLGAVIRLGAECPLPEDNWYFNASAELGAVNLVGRGDSLQLFTPTQASKDISTARVADGQTGEDIATFIRLIVGVAYRF